MAAVQPIALRCDTDLAGGAETVTVSIRITPRYDTLEDYLRCLANSEVQAAKMAERVREHLEAQGVAAWSRNRPTRISRSDHCTYTHLVFQLKKGRDTAFALEDIVGKNDEFYDMIVYDQNDFWEGG